MVFSLISWGSGKIGGGTVAQSQTVSLATDSAALPASGEALVDDAAFTPGTSKVVPAGFTFDDTAPDSVNEGDIGAARMSANRNIYTTLRDAAGNERGANIDASNQLSVVDSAVKTAVEIMDDWDESDRAKVNPIAGQAGVSGAFGVVNAATQRTVLADNGGPTSASRIVSAAASTNATSAKGSAGVLYVVRGVNAAGAARYLKLYDKATAPTVGTDTPVLTIHLPSGGNFNYEWPIGRYFPTGIAYALTTGVADADTGALTAADVLALNVEYR